MSPRLLVLASALICGCQSTMDTGDSLPSDPLQAALLRVASVDPRLAEDLAALPRIEDGVDDDELAAIEALATVVESAAQEDPRAVALLRSLPAAGFVQASEAPATDGVDDDWADAPRVRKATGQVDPNVDILEVAAQVAGDQLHVMVMVDGELNDDIAVGFYLDHGEGTLGVEEILLWNNNGTTQTYAYRWEGPLITDGWVSAATPSWSELATSGSVAELALPLDELAPDGGDGHLRIQAIAYDVVSGAYALAPNLSLRTAPTPGPVQELLELALVADVLADPALAVASAIAEAPLRLVVQHELLPQLRADGIAWFAYGLTLERIGGLGIWHKAAWSWRGQETTLYGVLPLYALPWRLDAEGYAHNVLTVEQLEWWVALAEDEGLLGDDDLGATVAAVEDWMDEVQDYRTYTEAMEAFCAKDWLEDENCEDWRKEVEAGDDYLGTVMGQPIYYYESSPTVQQAMWLERGALYGDCGSHTAVVAAILQGIGVPVAPGQYIADDGWVIHNFPIYLDAEAGLWRSYQLPCWNQYADDGAGFYQYIAPRHMEDQLSVEFSSAGDYGAGAIRYHHTTFGQLCDRLSAGVEVQEMEGMLFERWWADDLLD